MDESAGRDPSEPRWSRPGRRTFGRRRATLAAALAVLMLTLAGLVIWLAFSEDREAVVVIVAQDQVADAVALEGEITVVVGTIGEYRPAEHGAVEDAELDPDERIIEATAVLASEPDRRDGERDVDEVVDELEALEGRRVAAAGRLTGRVGERAFALESPD